MGIFANLARRLAAGKAVGLDLRFDPGSTSPTLAVMALDSFRHLHRVTYADCTVGNHVYYARYLDFLEAARGAFFLEIGLSLSKLQEEGITFPVIECRVRYKAPARYDDLLTITVQPVVVEGVRLNFAYQINNTASRLILQAETLHVCAGLNEKPKRMTRDLVDKLTPFLATEPEVEK